MLTSRSALFAVAITVVTTTFSQNVMAQSDGQPIRLIVGFAAGASTDVAARLIADKMRSSLGATVIVENKPGASGRIAVETVKNAAPDGKTLLVTPVAMMSIFPSVYKSLRYDPVKDFEPVTQLATFQYAVATNNKMPVKNLGELVTWIKAHPNEANYGSPAAGSLPHFYGVMFAKSLGTDMVHVPYKGSAPAATDLIGGQLPILFDLDVNLSEMHKAGKLRVLATSGSQRSSVLPDVPTFTESGFKINAAGWYGLYAPAKTPAATLQKLNQATVAALKSPEVKERFAKMGMDATGTTPAELAAIQKADAERWAPIVKASGFNPEE